MKYRYEKEFMDLMGFDKWHQWSEKDRRMYTAYEAGRIDEIELRRKTVVNVIDGVRD